MEVVGIKPMLDTGLNQVYWVEILSEEPNGLLITNPSLPGQKKVETVKKVIEKGLWGKKFK